MKGVIGVLVVLLVLAFGGYVIAQQTGMGGMMGGTGSMMGGMTGTQTDKTKGTTEMGPQMMTDEMVKTCTDMMKQTAPTQEKKKPTTK